MWWLWSLVIGCVSGSLITFAPFYFHALEDWDLADKSTLFPREIGDIIGFYAPMWLVGGAIGAALGLAAFGITRFLKSSSK